MEEVIPSFEYEILVFSSKPETSNEKELREILMVQDHHVYKKVEDEPRDLKKGKDILEREVINKTYALEQTLKPIESILQEVSSQEYVSAPQK